MHCIDSSFTFYQMSYCSFKKLSEQAFCRVTLDSTTAFELRHFTNFGEQSQERLTSYFTLYSSVKKTHHF